MSVAAGQPDLGDGTLSLIRAAGSGLGDPGLGGELLAHLELQLASARRMQAIVGAQARAIRRRAVRDVVVAAGELQVEMHRRELIERDRMALMQRAAAQLGTAPGAVGFTSIQQLLDAETGQLAAARTDELRRLLVDIDREHTLNRALMAQELGFLDHLLALAGGTGGYAARPGVGAAGSRGAGGGYAPRIRANVSAVPRRVYDLEA